MPNPLTFRNRQGELVDVPAVAATRLKNEFGAVLEQALRAGAVAITRHDAPKAVLVSYDEFQALAKAGSHSLSDLTAEYDALLGRMQTPAAKRGMARAFNASPVELGRVAVKATRQAEGEKRRSPRLEGVRKPSKGGRG
jgi:antitoxin Phd